MEEGGSNYLYRRDVGDGGRGDDRSTWRSYSHVDTSNRNQQPDQPVHTQLQTTVSGSRSDMTMRTSYDRKPVQLEPEKKQVYIPPHLRHRQQQPQQSGGLGPRSDGVGQSRLSSTGQWGTPSKYFDDIKQDLETVNISQQPTETCAPEYKDGRFLPAKRPQKGKFIVRSARLLVNHYPVSFNSAASIKHYNVSIKQVKSSGNRPARRSVPKSDLCLIREKLFSDDPNRFPLDMTAYDGEKNLFSSVWLPTGQFKVDLTDGEDMKPRTYLFTIKLVNELKLSRLRDYLNGSLPYVPRDILHGMDVVMKENPSRNRISIARNFYSKEFREEDDLFNGAAAYRGFQPSLRPTSQGLALCLDYSVLSLYKPMPVLEFLKEHVPDFRGVNDVFRLRRLVINSLKGLKVRVTHRATKQKHTIAGLSIENSRDISFDLIDPKRKNPPKKVSLVTYFSQKYGLEIVHKDIPCLDLGKSNNRNYVPMELCVLVEGQRYPKELLNENATRRLRRTSLAAPTERKKTICEMLQSEDGPSGTVARNFQIEVDKSMTAVLGRVIGAPNLKLGSPDGNMITVKVDKEKCQWNLSGKSVVEGKSVQRWALIDFTSSDHLKKLNAEEFVTGLRNRCCQLGIYMSEPLVSRFTDMHKFSAINRLKELLDSVIQEAAQVSNLKLQMIVCVMAKKHHGYKYLKWISETQIGIVTQCCLSHHANKGDDHYLANLGLKINAKLGGSNIELSEWLPHFEKQEHVMFIGADVNHPAAKNMTCPSIAAVVGTVNWPAATRYAARVCPQDHRTEKILNFGTMCVDLVNAYVQLNKVLPDKIIIFRDGVSEGQFDMVLNEELHDLKKAFRGIHYSPTITLVVVQKGHQTRLFLANGSDGSTVGNVLPGTVVDTTIVHPFEFDFYLCSHYGRLGTSKPTHYCVLWDENHFTSDGLQKLIYDLCFTFVRSTKPVTLVPPVHYADLVAYRGRLFQEVAKEFRSSSAASFDQSFYNLHQELQNIMFFV